MQPSKTLIGHLLLTAVSLASAQSLPVCFGGPPLCSLAYNQPHHPPATARARCSKPGILSNPTSEDNAPISACTATLGADQCRDMCLAFNQIQIINLQSALCETYSFDTSTSACTFSSETPIAQGFQLDRTSSVAFTNQKCYSASYFFQGAADLLQSGVGYVAAVTQDSLPVLAAEVIPLAYTFDDSCSAATNCSSQAFAYFNAHHSGAGILDLSYLNSTATWQCSVYAADSRDPIEVSYTVPDPDVAMFYGYRLALQH